MKYKVNTDNLDWAKCPKGTILTKNEDGNYDISGEDIYFIDGKDMEFMLKYHSNWFMKI